MKLMGKESQLAILTVSCTQCRSSIGNPCWDKQRKGFNEACWSRRIHWVKLGHPTTRTSKPYNRQTVINTTDCVYCEAKPGHVCQSMWQGTYYPKLRKIPIDQKNLHSQRIDKWYYENNPKPLNKIIVGNT